MEAIILAGGLGTRLRSVVSDLPKPMASVKGKPFLKYVLDWLYGQKIDRVVLAVGYKHEIIQQYFGEGYCGMEIAYSVENEPLGTGGAIKQAFSICRENSAIIANGDTLFPINISELVQYYNGYFSVACHFQQDAGRYGIVCFGKERITGFTEKGIAAAGYVNGGIYMANRQVFMEFGSRFSLEKDVLPLLVQNGMVTGVKSDTYFIDIGVPEDYARANREL